MTKWNRVRDSFTRAHDDLFSDSQYTAKFYNWDGGAYEPDRGDITGQSRNWIGTIQIEIVPPAMDATVKDDGTSFSFDTSIRFPEETSTLTIKSGESYTVESNTTEQYGSVTVESNATLTVNGSLIAYSGITINGTLINNGSVTTFGTDDFADTLIPLGEDNERPTEVEIENTKTNSTDRYELQGFTTELGSGFIMCRLVEQ